MPIRSPLPLFFCITVCHAADDRVYAADWPMDHARCRPVPLTSVKAAGFLGGHIEANRASLLAGLRSRIRHRAEARAAGREPDPSTNQRLAADSDLYKWMEGAAYTAVLTGDLKLSEELERTAAMVIACQKPDGYINTQAPPNERFDTRINHDLYTAGHFFEAAAAHYRATGKTHLIDAARRWATYLLSEYDAGNPYFQTVARREHSEYELGLLRLYRATHDARFLDFSIALTRLIPVTPMLITGRHAVRTNYLLAGYADLALETGRDDFRAGLGELWDEIVATRSFVTGGVSVHEAYQKEPYYLPQITTHQRRDIAETCTSLSLIMFAWRMHALTGESRFFDQIETILYNHALGAVSLDHLATFYYNPLRLTTAPKDKTDHDGPLACRTRLPEVHSTSCCITNEWRFFGALTEYLFSYDAAGIYANLYTAGRLRHTLASGAEAAFSVETAYPHQGVVLLRMENKTPARYALRLRVPAWASGATVAVGKEQPRPASPGQYVVIDRTWKAGDIVRLQLPMPVRVVRPNPRDTENRGQAVLARGPLVYCMEQQDVAFPIDQSSFDGNVNSVRVQWRSDLLEGVNVLTAPGRASGRPVYLKFVPFYAHANRGTENRWMTYVPLDRK